MTDPSERHIICEQHFSLSSLCFDLFDEIVMHLKTLKGKSVAFEIYNQHFSGLTKRNACTQTCCKMVETVGGFRKLLLSVFYTSRV